MSFLTTIPEALAAYEQWLARQPLSSHTRRYGTYLSTLRWEYGHPLQEPHACDYAARDYKTALKAVQHAKPSSVNLALAAVDHFYRFLELPPPQVKREDLPAQAPGALEPPEQKRFLRAVERCASVRDRAIVLLLFYAGLRISECAALTMDDARLTSRKGLVIVRMGKGNTYREIPLNAEVRTALDAWQEQRKQLVAEQNESALFLTKQGTRCFAAHPPRFHGFERTGRTVHLLREPLVECFDIDTKVINLPFVVAPSLLLHSVVLTTSDCDLITD